MKEDGGPAFPCAPKMLADVQALNDGSGVKWIEISVSQGMSLRDYLAAAALQGIYSWFADTPVVPEVAAGSIVNVVDGVVCP